MTIYKQLFYSAPVKLNLCFKTKMIPADSNLHHSFFPKLDFNQGESTFFNPLQKSLQSFANSFLPEESEKWGLTMWRGCKNSPCLYKI